MHSSLLHLSAKDPPTVGRMWKHTQMNHGSASSQRTLHRIPKVLFDSKYKDWECTTGPVPTCPYKQLTVTCVTDSAESSNKYTPTYHKRKDLCQSIHNTSESHRPQTGLGIKSVLLCTENR